VDYAGDATRMREGRNREKTTGNDSRKKEGKSMSKIGRCVGKALGIRTYDRRDYLIQGHKLVGWRTVMSQDVTKGKMLAAPWPVAKVYQLAKTAMCLVYVWLDGRIEIDGRKPIMMAMDIYRNDIVKLKARIQGYQKELMLYAILLREARKKTEEMEKKLLEKEPINASESIYGFLTWLTTIKGTFALGHTHDIVPAIQYAKRWCATNKLEDVRNVYPGNITMPKENAQEEANEAYEHEKCALHK
jgi:hypothetical protein